MRLRRYLLGTTAIALTEALRTRMSILRSLAAAARR